MKNAIDRIDLIKPRLAGKRVGLLTNYTGLNLRLKSTVDIIREIADLRVILSPEHGLYGVAQANEKVADSTYRDTGIPIISVFDKDDERPDWVDRMDILVYDIQDIGVRFFTYIYALSDTMILCQKHGIPVLVLDRYNPLGLRKTEGTMLERPFSSIVGRYPIPSRYALTVGEIARYFNTEEKIGCDLSVIPCEGLTRDMDHTDCGVPWVIPSPNCPTTDTVLCYIGTVLFEGTNLSEGRGTTKPFEVFGAPYLQAEKLAKQLNDLHLPGVLFRYHPFVPTFSKYEGEVCQGVMLHILDKNTFSAFEACIRIIDLIRNTYREFDFRYYDGWGYAMDKLLGTDAFRQDGFDPDTFIEEQKAKVAAFDASKYYLYE